MTDLASESDLRDGPYARRHDRRLTSTSRNSVWLHCGERGEVFASAGVGIGTGEERASVGVAEALCRDSARDVRCEEPGPLCVCP
jgi:hypothetical protein